MFRCLTVVDPVSVFLTVDPPVQVFLLGRRVKEDLLMVARAVKDCYPPQMDIVNLYAGLFHQNFSARLTGLVASGPDADDCRYLLFWINHYYPQ